MILFSLPVILLLCHQISSIPIPNGLLDFLFIKSLHCLTRPNMSTPERKYAKIIRGNGKIEVVERKTLPQQWKRNVEVECTDTTIEAVFLTESNFLGRVFVLGHSQDKECVSREIGRRTTSITVPRDKCGVETVHHGKGAGYTSSVNIVISFHDKFLTKVDRAYNITCLFAPTGDVVSYALTVQPSILKDIQVLAEQPSCEYEVFDVRTRRPAEVVHANAPLEHVWTCDGANLDLFCMRVHDCVINEGKSKRRSKIIDSEGCSLDTTRLPNIRYDNNKLSARVMSKAFRFGDDVAVEFECNVRLDLRNGTSCPRPRC